MSAKISKIEALRGVVWKGETYGGRRFRIRSSVRPGLPDWVKPFTIEEWTEARYRFVQNFKTLEEALDQLAILGRTS